MYECLSSMSLCLISSLWLGNLRHSQVQLTLVCLLMILAAAYVESQAGGPLVWANYNDLRKFTPNGGLCGEKPPNHLISGW